jgi:hypothetical protein
MNVGYFSINHGTNNGKVDWQRLNNQQVIEKGKFFRHIRFEKPLMIRMDGRKGIAVITMNK